MELSIIIPTYNRLEMLKNALSSVLSESAKIIITDDGSTDGTREWCEDLCLRNANIIYVRNEKYKKGPNGNKNNGLDFVDTEYFTFLDDDDWFLPNGIATMIAKIKEGYAAVFASCLKSTDGAVAGVTHGVVGEFGCSEYICGKLEGEFAVIFRSDALGELRFDAEQYGAESVLWGKVLRDKKMYYMDFAAKMYRVGHTSVMTTLFDNATRGLVCYQNLISEFSDELLEYCPKTLVRYYSLMYLYASLSGDVNAKKEALSRLIALRGYMSLSAAKTFIAAFLPLFVLKKIYGLNS